MIGQAVPVPALNKWTQVYPVVRQLSLGGCLHNLMPRAIEYAHTLAVPELATDVQRDEPSSDEGENVGMPRTKRKAQAREKAARSSKSLTWMKNPSTLPTLLVWISIAQHVMKLHFALFRDSTSMRSDKVTSPVFEFADPSRSRARKAIAALTAMLGPEQGNTGWQVLCDRWGARWPSGAANKARSGLLLVYGQLWRRLVWFFERPPWRWAKICDESISLEELGDAKLHGEGCFSGRQEVGALPFPTPPPHCLPPRPSSPPLFFSASSSSSSSPPSSSSLPFSPPPSPFRDRPGVPESIAPPLCASANGGAASRSSKIASDSAVLFGPWARQEVEK